MLKMYFANLTWKGFLETCRTSRKLVLFIVFVALFLDNMLLTTVVPIIPNFLYLLDHPEERINNSASPSPSPAVSALPDLVILCRGLSGDTSTSSAVDKDQDNHTEPARSRRKYELCMNATALNRTAMADKQKERTRHEYIMNEHVHVGLMFASKAFVQIVTNPFIGPLTNRIGYSIPMFSGFVIMFVSTIIFAFAESYTVLFLARAVQGIGSACSSVSGMGMLADRFPDDKERGNAMGIALGGLALGVLVGPPFGAVMYKFTGKEIPFLILATLALFDGLLILTVLKPGVHPEAHKGSSVFKLLRDPYILLAAGSITFANTGIAMLEPSLPLWMMDTMHAPEWEQGMAFLPASISYLIGTNIFGPLAHKIGRWLSAMIGMIVIGICLFVIPLSKNIGHLIAPNFGLGFSIGMVDSAMMPLLGYLVDVRHVSVYGSVYAIGDIAFCVGFAIGPALSGSTVKYVGFNWMLWIIAIINFIYAPLLYFLRNPPRKGESTCLMMSDTTKVKYVSYNKQTKGRENLEDDFFYDDEK